MRNFSNRNVINLNEISCLLSQNIVILYYSLFNQIKESTGIIILRMEMHFVR